MIACWVHNDFEVCEDFNKCVTKQETGISCSHNWEFRIKKYQGMSTTFTDKSEQKALDHEELRTQFNLVHFQTMGISVIGTSVSAVNPVPIGSENRWLRLRN